MDCDIITAVLCDKRPSCIQRSEGGEKEGRKEGRGGCMETRMRKMRLLDGHAQVPQPLKEEKESSQVAPGRAAHYH